MDSVTVVLTGAQLQKALRIARKIVETGKAAHVETIAEVGEMVRLKENISPDMWNEAAFLMYTEQGELIDAAAAELDDVQLVAFGRVIAGGVYVFSEAVR